MTESQFEGIGSQFEGISAFMDSRISPTVQERSPELTDDAPVPDESWSWEDWQRYAGVMVLRDTETRMDRMLLGDGMPEMTWQEADDLYGLVQARAAEEAAQRYAADTRRYWSGPDKLDRQILRTYGVTAAQVGLAPRSVFDGRYRQRQRNRARRRR